MRKIGSATGLSLRLSLSFAVIALPTLRVDNRRTVARRMSSTQLRPIGWTRGKSLGLHAAMSDKPGLNPRPVSSV